MSFHAEAYEQDVRVPVDVEKDDPVFAPRLRGLNTTVNSCIWPTEMRGRLDFHDRKP